MLLLLLQLFDTLEAFDEVEVSVLVVVMVIVGVGIEDKAEDDEIDDEVKTLVTGLVSKDGDGSICMELEGRPT